jgi:hypothetical protein
MTKYIGLKAMNQGTALARGTLALTPLVIEGLEEFKGSFDRLCLRAGTAAIETMLVADAEQLCGKRYQRHPLRSTSITPASSLLRGSPDRRAHRWGLIGSEIGWHGGKAAIRRPRVRQRGGAELQLASWKAIQEADLLSRWAFNQMLIGVVPDVLVVQPGEDWDGDNDTGPLDRPTQLRILAQRQVRAHLIVIRRIRSKNSPQVRLTKDQHSIDALAAHGADQARNKLRLYGLAGMDISSFEIRDLHRSIL